MRVNYQRLIDYLDQFDDDQQERICRYALDHIIPRLKSTAPAPPAKAQGDQAP